MHDSCVVVSLLKAIPIVLTVKILGNFRGGEGPGTMGERVVRRGVGERLPGKVTWGRVVHHCVHTRRSNVPQARARARAAN